jgi:hypothetical protein
MIHERRPAVHEIHTVGQGQGEGLRRVQGDRLNAYRFQASTGLNQNGALNEAQEVGEPDDGPVEGGLPGVLRESVAKGLPFGLDLLELLFQVRQSLLQAFSVALEQSPFLVRHRLLARRHALFHAPEIGLHVVQVAPGRLDQR